MGENMLIGIDILDVKRIKIIERKGCILNRLFTPAEINSIEGLSYRKRIMTLACMYAAKEATAKALGTGFDDDIEIQDIQILIDDQGKGKVSYFNGSRNLINKLGIIKTHLALGIEKELVIALVVLEN